ncbi:MAG TPA: hypothetical protein VHQ01_00890, partial [Pyrinomonadaceae bacterium]|nr:hypothetical protein [Pyrinomonadaceae bacterium]
MKRCPECRRDYYDDTLSFCLNDGTELVYGLSPDEPATAILSEPPASTGGRSVSENPTRPFIHTTAAEPEPKGNLGDSTEKQRFSARRTAKPLIIGVVVLALLAGGFFGYRYFAPFGSKQTESIAVMPFVNESGNADVEYLADGMTETLISSLSNIPNLSVKARSTVFYYKGKETSAKKIGEELKVQAVLFGRVSQRGDDLKLSLELVNTETQDVIWSEQYNRKQADLVTLQADIARDVSAKLKIKLSGADVAKVEKNSTVNPKAYQLYLKGLFQYNRRTGDSLKQAAEFFQQAIENDPNYAQAYSSLARTYTSFSSWSLAE